MWDILSKIPELLDLKWADLAKVLLGSGLVGYLAYGWVRSNRKATKAQIRAEQHRLDAESARLQSEHAREIAELKELHATDKLGLQQQIMQMENDHNRLQSTLASLEHRLHDLESFDGKLWEQDNLSTPAEFVLPQNRKARIISIVNLKGGVGKTTLTANIGISLARRNRRVLLIDLDFQGSLTRLCTGKPERLLEIIQKRKTCARLLEGQGSFEHLDDIIFPINHPSLVGKSCDYIAADEMLAEAEIRAQAKWLVTKTPDVRYTFRKIFHDPKMRDRYDFILFDCPPRLTTACVNALACSDFLLVPVLLDQGSVEALPRTLNWLKQFPHVSRARLLGVVANRVDFYGGKPVSAQQTVYDYIPETLKRFGFYDTNVIRTIIKNQRAVVEDAANQRQIASMDDRGLALFESLVEDLERGVNR